MSTPCALSASVITCTWSCGRLPLLLETLDSVRQQTVQPLEVIVVVDHNPPLLRLLHAAVPWCHVVPNVHPQGASGARNTGIAAARGEVVALLDDDALPEARWLERLLLPYGDDRVLAVGGRSIARWERERPRWFPPAFDWVVGCSFPGMPRQTTPVRNLWGLNMSVRRHALEQTGMFHPGFGPHGAVPGCCEETELCVRLVQQRPAALVLYTPFAAVHHFVPVSRCRRRYLLRRCYVEGRFKARAVALWRDAGILTTERSYVWRELIPALLRDLTLLHRPRAFPGALERLAATCTASAAVCAGYLHGMVERAAEPAGNRAGAAPSPRGG